MILAIIGLILQEPHRLTPSLLLSPVLPCSPLPLFRLLINFSRLTSARSRSSPRPLSDRRRRHRLTDPAARLRFGFQLSAERVKEPHRDIAVRVRGRYTQIACCSHC